jgi:hypothetical protein
MFAVSKKNGKNEIQMSFNQIVTNMLENIRCTYKIVCAHTHPRFQHGGERERKREFKISA